MFLSACLWRQAIINFSFEQIIWVFWLVWQTETSSLPISSCVSRQTTVWFHIFAQVIFCNIDKVKRKQVGTVKYFFLFSPPDRFVCLRTLKLYHEFKELWVWQFFSTILLGCWVQVKIYKKSNKYQHLNQYLNISGIITRLGENRDCKNPASITQGGVRWPTGPPPEKSVSMKISWFLDMEILDTDNFSISVHIFEWWSWLRGATKTNFQ